MAAVHLVSTEALASGPGCITSARPSSRPVSAYAQLMREVRATRLLERSPLGYLPRALVLLAMFAVGGTVFWSLGSSWWQLLVAAWSAVVAAQIGFLGHDAGHQQIFRSRRWNVRFGTLVSGIGIGLSYGWWVDKHNRHHQHPNDPASDPDVGRGALAWNADQVRRQPAALRAFTAHQAQLFFPLLMLEALHLRANSLRSVLADPRRRWAEGLLLLLNTGVYLGLLFWWLSPLQAVAFVVVHQALLGLYLGCSFAPNHKGMHMPQPGEDLDFLRRQVVTSRNVTGGRLLAAGLGSLNYQIEHHLFPSMPSRNLARCQPVVREFCRRQEIPYCEMRLVASYASGLRYLAAVARQGGRPASATVE